MAPVENQPAAVEMGVPHIVVGPDGERFLHFLSTLPASTRARQIAVRPQEDRLLIFQVGGAKGDAGDVSMLRQELVETVQLPESVDPFTVEASINDEGLLEVRAPLAH
jgi:hypothetical protein